ncbi:MAG: exodeoxyribonuclease III, partial [Myxococcales bacterium]
MRLTTWNVNGLRAALKKGMRAHLDRLSPDVLLMQEIRCTPEQMPEDFQLPSDWSLHWHAAEKRGWSGVATWSRLPIERLGVGMDEPDPDGRILRVRIAGVQLVNVYLPFGAAGPERQRAKEEWMARFLPWAAGLAKSPEPVILAGDLNIAHTERDVANPARAKKISGFYPHERERFGRLLASGWTDCVRAHFGERQGPYSWWSNFGKARELDRGWRIDHVLANAPAAHALKSVHIDREAGLCCS